MEKNQEKIIGKIVHNILSIEWMRYNMFSTNDIYRNVPMLVFRLEESAPMENLKKLESCVRNFKGEKRWQLFQDPLSKKGNYLLTISIIKDIRVECYKKNIIYNEKEYLGDENYKICCRQAVQDIPLLAEHIIKCFK